MTAELRGAFDEELRKEKKLRRTRVLTALGVAASSWYRPALAADERRRPGPSPQAIPEGVRQAVIDMASIG